MDELAWLQRWYASQCDGDWEHTYGVKIDTLDNPGWWVQVDLVETPLAGHPDTVLLVLGAVGGEDGSDWVNCRIKAGRFDGAGGPHMLTAILKCFREWAERVGPVVD
jgi:hypothetical protein